MILFYLKWIGLIILVAYTMMAILVLIINTCLDLNQVKLEIAAVRGLLWPWWMKYDLPENIFKNLKLIELSQLRELTQRDIYLLMSCFACCFIVAFLAWSLA